MVTPIRSAIPDQRSSAGGRSSSALARIMTRRRPASVSVQAAQESRCASSIVRSWLGHVAVQVLGQPVGPLVGHGARPPIGPDAAATPCAPGGAATSRSRWRAPACRRSPRAGTPRHREARRSAGRRREAERSLVSISIEVSGGRHAGPAPSPALASPSRYRWRWTPRRSRRPRITLMASRWSQVPKAASPRNVPSFSQARTKTSCAASSASSSLEHPPSQAVNPPDMPPVEPLEGVRRPRSRPGSRPRHPSRIWGSVSRRSVTGPGRVRVIARDWIGIRGERLQRQVVPSRAEGLLVILGRGQGSCHP